MFVRTKNVINSLQMMCDVVLNSRDLVSAILAFARRDEYLFVGLVNRAFCCAYETKKTNVAHCFKSVCRLRESTGAPSFTALTSVPCHVMKCGSIDVMRHALHARFVDNLNGALEHAIRSDDAELTLTLNTEFRETRIGPACLIAAVESGSLALVRQYCRDGVLDHRAPNFGLGDSYFYPFDLRAKQMICHRWKMYVGDYLIEAAKRGGHFEILRWLHSENIPSVDEMSETHDIIGEAAAHGNRDMVEWMLLVGYHPSACEIPYACHSNDVDFLEWLLKKGCILDPEALDRCENTDPRVLDWLESKGFVF